jgi:hypothetical protein
MTISYKIVGITGWLPLLDTQKGDGSAYFKPKFTENVSSVPGFGSSSQSIVPFANTQVSHSIPLNRTYQTLALALAAIRLLRSLKGLSLHLMVVQDTETQYYPNGVLREMEANLSGCSVDYMFTFLTQDVTVTAPTT